MQLADDMEVHHRRGGIEGAVAAARAGSGREFDPDLVTGFARHGPGVLASLPAESSWEELVRADPDPRPLAVAETDAALEAMADFVDLKSPWFAGHSRGVADLAAAAARTAGHPAEDVRLLRRAGLLHDLGRSGVPNTIWDKPGPLTAVERERVELHSYYTDRMLRRVPALAGAGAIAALAHERLDGSGYHRGATAAALPPAARVLAAADAYHAMTEPRPHREALPPHRAADLLGREAREGRLDVDSVGAVLEAAGHAAPRLPRPAGLTERESEVVALLARGLQTKQIARALGISAKTADRHVQNAYAKIGFSTRAAAAVFAMRHGLAEWGELPIVTARDRS